MFPDVLIRAIVCDVYKNENGLHELLIKSFGFGDYQVEKLKPVDNRFDSRILIFVCDENFVKMEKSYRCLDDRNFTFAIPNIRFVDLPRKKRDAEEIALSKALKDADKDDDDDDDLFFGTSAIKVNKHIYISILILLSLLI
jgi:hypothetical protein